MSVLDEKKAYQRYFEEMSKIPHGSLDEKRYSDYLGQFAQNHNLSYMQDEMWNVIIYKAGSKGYEDHEPVLLQAHMDMVCEKNRDCEFDFEKDELKLTIDGEWLSAEGTTLGADDGTGCAYMLAILESDEMAHPPLECVFTVQEEIGLFGALGLKKENIHAKRLINLDGGGEVSTCTTSAGGVNVISKRRITKEATTCDAYQLSIGGLFGGHSGGQIHMERGNANKLMARILYSIHQLSPIQLGSIEGGLKDNAIPREAIVSFTCEMDEANITSLLDKASAEILKELEFSDAGFTSAFTKTKLEKVMSKEDSEAYLCLMRLLPDGMRHHSMSIEGLTTASMNAAIVSYENDEVMINCSIRGALESYIDTIAEEVELLSHTFGFETHREARYPAWSYDAISPMRETLQNVYRSLYEKELELIAVHGGLECGVFKAMDPDMDIVTMGPIALDVHTPKERLNLPSFDRTFVLLTTFLSKL